MRFMLVDASHLAHRCRHAQVGRLVTSDGKASGVVYGFLRGLDYAMRQTAVDAKNVIVVWDGGRSAKRMQLLPSYKESRRKVEPPTPEEIAEKEAFYSQLSAIREGVSLLGVRNIRVEGTEADDLIALLAVAMSDRGDNAVIFSGDKDLQQLVSDSITVFHPQHEVMAAPQVQAKWNISHPQEIVRFLSLVGDNSDDISGVKGVGPKRAPLVLPYWESIWNDSEKPDDVSDAAWKWVVICRQFRDEIRRNIALIQLPRTWDESFYGIDVAIAVADQLKDGAVRKFPEFVAWCNVWELRDLTFSHW